MTEREDNTDEFRAPWENVTDLKASIKVLSAKVSEQDQRKCEVKDKLQQLRERISPEGVDVSVQELMSHLRSLKELAAMLRDIVSLKRQIDDVPCQSERLQYERRFSELNICIQEKLQQTRKLYATYNALTEIKDLILKETSLLNSIGSQFQDLIGTPDGRVKLIDSMEGVMKGIQQKIGKVQLGLQEEQRLCDISKEKYIAASAEQRKCYTILRAFQEECTKNDRLSQISALKTSDSKEEVE